MEEPSPDEEAGMTFMDMLVAAQRAQLFQTVEHEVNNLINVMHGKIASKEPEDRSGPEQSVMQLLEQFYYHAMVLIGLIEKTDDAMAIEEKMLSMRKSSMNSYRKFVEPRDGGSIEAALYFDAVESIMNEVFV